MMLTYWLLALVWFVLVVIRGSYLWGRRAGGVIDGEDLFWYILPWGILGGVFWPMTLIGSIGPKMGQENP